MIYKMYGKTGHRVSAVGFGGMRFDTKLPKEKNAELLHYAFEKGINYFDSAPGYCDDQSLDIFGIALPKLPRDKFYVTSKCMPTAVQDGAEARKAVESDLKRLHLDKIDFFYVWCIRHLDQYKLAMKKGGQYEALQKCKAEGLIGHIVVSTHLNGSDTAEILSRNEFDGVLLGVSAINFPYRWQGVQSAYDSGLGVVAMNPLAGGIIPKNEDRFKFLASKGETPTEAALRFCISCPQITVTLNGFTTREHIDMACKVADKAKPFTQKDIDAFRQNISEGMDKLCTGCGYCLGLCPVNVHVPSYMQFYNDIMLGNPAPEKLPDSVRGQHKWGLLAHSAIHADACVQCGKCEQACTQHLSIVERLREIASWEKDAGL
jgi:predicted aldo/keto reductase-like oxidoreductase